MELGRYIEFPSGNRNPVFFLSLLEDSGYMARVAFGYGQAASKDRTFRKKHRADAGRIWMYGTRSYGERTLPSERDRKMTILLTPFMSCSAKLPIYAFLRQHFFRITVRS